MTTKRIVYSIFLLHILLCFSWWILHMCLSDDLQLNVVLDSILYYGMLCTLPIWLYPIVRVIKKTFNYNEILGVLAIILISGIVFVVGFIGLLLFTIEAPKAVWYEDKNHIITDGYASVGSFFVCDRGGIVNKVRSKGRLRDSPLIPDSAQWKFYDQWGVLVAWSDNKLDNTRSMKAYSLFVIDSLLYKRHQKEILNLRKSYLAKEQNYILKGFLSYEGGSIPTYEFGYNTKTRMITVYKWGGYYQEGCRIKLSKSENDSIITLIRQHPEAQVRDDDYYDRYGKGKMCSSLEVNNRTIFDCVGSDFSRMPAPFRDIMRLFASKDVQGNELLLSLDKSK